MSFEYSRTSKTPKLKHQQEEQNWTQLMVEFDKCRKAAALILVPILIVPDLDGLVWRFIAYFYHYILPDKRAFATEIDTIILSLFLSSFFNRKALQRFYKIAAGRFMPERRNYFLLLLHNSTNTCQCASTPPLCRYFS